MGSVALIYIPSFVKIDFDGRKGAKSQKHEDLISSVSFLQNKENRLKGERELNSFAVIK